MTRLICSCSNSGNRLCEQLSALKNKMRLLKANDNWRSSVSSIATFASAIERPTSDYSMMTNKENIQDAYQVAIRYAAERHGAKRQMVPGTKLPYLLHLSNVAMEVLAASRYMKSMDLKLAVQVALLHDTMEDTATRKTQLEKKFGIGVADGVAALTKKKKKGLTKTEKMNDSLARIKNQPREVWCVKLADRITNLQKPPSTWDLDKRKAYASEAKQILDALRGANAFLEKRLRQKIRFYQSEYCK